MINDAKARFRCSDAFRNYSEWMKANEATVQKQIFELLKNSYGEKSVASDFENRFFVPSMGLVHFSAERFLTALEPVEAYIEAQGAWYNASAEFRGLRFLSYGDFPAFPVPMSANLLAADARFAADAWPAAESNPAAGTFLELRPLRDNKTVPLAALRCEAALTDGGKDLLADPNETLTVATLEGQAQALDAEIDRIGKYDVPGLKEAKAELDRAQSELNQKMSALREKMNAMKSDMEKRLQALKWEIRVLTDKIYMIECYLGDSYELFQIRTGKPAPEDQPVIVLQKLRYLDEDLAQLFSLYAGDMDGSGYHVIEDLFKHNDQAVDLFCPYDRCVTFFRISKDNRNFYSAEKNLLDTQKLLHGNKIGFLIRNGENLFVGYVDDDSRDKDAKVVIKDDVFYRPAVIEGADPKDEPIDTPYGEKVSRAFCFFILEGILKRRELLAIPEPYTLMDNGGYVVFSYADNNIEDKKFGDFSTLLSNLNRLHTEGDTILVMMRLCETYQKRGGNERGLRRGDVNRTHDCHVEDGLNRINLVDENGFVYVSAKKEWSYKGARSNFRLDRSEYLNLTFCNSVWLRYFLSTKSLGQMRLGGMQINFAYAAQYLKMALDLILRREEKERVRIIGEYPKLDSIPEWQVLLSHWKIVNHVREITTFQARRFAKALASGETPMLRHLYEEIPDFHEKRLPRRRKCYIDYEGVKANGLGEKADKKEIADMLAEDTRTLTESAAALREEVTAAGLDYDALAALAKEYEGKALPGSGFYDSRICRRLLARMERYLDRNLSPVPLEPDEEIVRLLFSNNRDSWKDFLKDRERNEALLPIAYVNAQIHLYGQLYDIVRQYEEDRYFMESKNRG